MSITPVITTVSTTVSTTATTGQSTGAAVEASTEASTGASTEVTAETLRGACPQCGSPARVEWYKRIASGPEGRLAKVRCDGGHWFLGPIDRVLATERV